MFRNAPVAFWNEEANQENFNPFSLTFFKNSRFLRRTFRESTLEALLLQVTQFCCNIKGTSARLQYQCASISIC